MLRLDRVELVLGAFRLRADWSVPRGSRVAVIGPSGGGKSSLLLAIADFTQPATGQIIWDGHDLAPLDPGARPVSILFQDQNLFPHLTIARNLGLGLNPRLRLSQVEWAQIDTVLGNVGLEGMGARLPSTLSGGQIGRAALARAILRARPLLLLDEPFAALGPALKADMMALVTKVGQATQATTLMVTHDPEDARRHTDLTILVADGIAHPPAATAALFANPPAALQIYLGS